VRDEEGSEWAEYLCMNAGGRGLNHAEVIPVWLGSALPLLARHAHWDLRTAIMYI